MRISDHNQLKRQNQRSQRATAALLPGILLAAGAFAQQPAPQTAAQPGNRAAHAAPHPTSRHSTVRAPYGDAPVAAAPLTPEEQATQVLNRFTFGPRPGEIAEVAREGWETWFDQQLNPASIPNAALDRKLAQYPALQLSPQQLAIQYPDGQVIRRIANGKFAMPQDPQLAGVYEVLLTRYERKQAEDKAAAAAPAVASAPGTPSTPGNALTPGGVVSQGGNGPRPRGNSFPSQPAASVAPGRPAEPANAAPPVAPALNDAQLEGRRQQQKEQDRIEARMLADQILGYPKNLRMQAIFKLPVEQRMVLTSGIADPEKSLLTNDMTPHEKELFGMMAGGYGGSGVIATEMQQAKVVRAVLSERQLQEVMTDFWFNHFNIDLGKSGDMLDYANSYERDAIRAHALGRFRDLLLATAEHPAMLIYLDNWLSIGPDSQAAGKPKPGAKAPQRGLNENYGREVMELHTVGVDGGYTQADVTSLAKILTGWTVDQPQMGGGFVFEPRRHEPGVKAWFGQKIGSDQVLSPGPNAGPNPAQEGMNEGVRALTFLAAQPETAHFLSFELAQRFVSDTPPPALVNRMAAAYLSSDGDISTVLRTMVHSPEFFARANYRNKVKMPLEYVASSLRATGTDPTNPGALANELKTMGEPLYRCLPPTGYASTADHWMNSAALVDRLNYALQLTGGHFGGMRFDASRLLAAGLLSRPGPTPAVALTHPIALRSQDGLPSGQQEALELMERLLVPGVVSEKTNAVIRQQMALGPADAGTGSTPRPGLGSGAGSGPGAAPSQQLASASVPPLPDPSEALDKLAAMILGSPEFQVH
jgi:uncharacterized protein (DUF1800 family)